MTNEERKVMKQALEALEKSRPIDQSSTIPHNKHVSAITAIREALAQEQEPVAWLHNGKLHEFDPSDWATGPVTPLYTSPLAKPWVNPSIKEYEDIMLANITPRTEDERDGIMCALNDMVGLLKEKNNGAR